MAGKFSAAPATLVCSDCLAGLNYTRPRAPLLASCVHSIYLPGLMACTLRRHIQQRFRPDRLRKLQRWHLLSRSRRDWMHKL